MFFWSLKKVPEQEKTLIIWAASKLEELAPDTFSFFPVRDKANIYLPDNGPYLFLLWRIIDVLYRELVVQSNVLVSSRFLLADRTIKILKSATVFGRAASLKNPERETISDAKIL